MLLTLHLLGRGYFLLEQNSKVEVSLNLSGYGTDSCKLHFLGIIRYVKEVWQLGENKLCTRIKVNQIKSSDTLEPLYNLTFRRRVI